MGDEETMWREISRERKSKDIESETFRSSRQTNDAIQRVIRLTSSECHSVGEFIVSQSVSE